MSMFLSRDEVREVDRRAIEEFGLPGVVLMENAGRGAADVLLRLSVRGRVVICCGKGNNGGDGFVIARHLDNHGVSVAIHLFAHPDEVTGDAAINYHVVVRSGLPVTVHAGPAPHEAVLRREFADAEWVVDALFGTGLAGPVRPPLDRVIRLMNEKGKRILAVDIPSGLDCDTGQPLGEVVRADQTVTFVAPKKGFAAIEARAYLGTVQVVDIGLPRGCLPPAGGGRP
jgi:NAD(P)H-hydrate epimerase